MQNLSAIFVWIHFCKLLFQASITSRLWMHKEGEQLQRFSSRAWCTTGLALWSLAYLEKYFFPFYEIFLINSILTPPLDLSHSYTYSLWLTLYIVIEKILWYLLSLLNNDGQPLYYCVSAVWFLMCAPSPRWNQGFKEVLLIWTLLF